MLTTATQDCTRAALINAVFALLGEEAAGHVRELIDREERLYENIKPLGEIFKRAKGLHVRCRVLRDIEAQVAIHKANRRVAFDFLAAKRAGVYVVCLREDACVHQAVVVDANSEVITDSEETCALRLSAELLMRCGSPKMESLRVRDVRW